MALGDDLKEYGKQKINAVVSALKVKLIIAGIIAIVVFVVVLFCIALLTVLAGDDDDNSGTSSSDMADASGDQWEFFIEHYLKSWEGNEGYNSDKTKYKIGLVKGNRTVGYGIDLETSGAEAKLKALGYTSLNVGDYVKVEDVDAIMYEEAKKWYNSVKNSMTSNGVTAKEYQIYAFTDFCYNCGHVGDFYGSQSVGTAYKNYYNSDIDNWYGNYKKYSKTEALAAKLLEYDKSVPYNQRRRAADGCLFQTGYYGYDIKRTDISTDNRGADAYYQMSSTGSGGAVQQYLKKIQDEGIKCNTHKISLAPGTTYNHYGYQCKGYAMCLFYKCFKITPGTTKGNNYELNSTSGMKLVGTVKVDSAKDAKELFSKAKPGDFVQMKRSHGGPHSAIVYSVDSDGTTWMENNTDNKCGTYLTTHSWSNLADKNQYISVYTATDYSLKK